MEKESWARAEAAFTAYGIPLTPITYFRHLRRVLSENNDNWLAVLRKLRKAQRKWERLTRLLSREGSDSWTLGQIYLVVVQLVMLYRSETWVMKPRIRRVLGVFHHRVARRLTGRKPRRGREGV